MPRTAGIHLPNNKKMPPYSRGQKERKKNNWDRLIKGKRRTGRRKGVHAEKRVAEEQRRQGTIICGKQKSKSGRKG